MKKLLIILIAAFGVTAASAQSSYSRQDDYKVYQQNDQWNNNDRNNERDYGYNNNNNNRNSNYNHQRQEDHVYQYDKRVDFKRDRQIREAERVRQEKAKSFGTGLVVGGAAALLLGVLISH